MTFPTDFMTDIPKPASFKIDRMVTVLRSVPITGAHKAQTRQIGEGYWECDLDYNPMKGDHFGPLVSYLNQKNGMHETFGVLLPNFDSSNILAPGNYISLSNGKCVQIQDTGSLVNDSVFVATTNPSPTETRTNSFAAVAGEPLAVYVEAESVYTDATLTIKRVSDDVVVANSANIGEGRTFACLTPTVSGNVYVCATHGSVATVTNWSVNRGLLVSTSNAQTAPPLQASDSASYFLPGPVAAMPVSLDSNKFSVTYGKDSFIKLKIGLIERR